MKKLKFMLLSFAILAVVGTALAFKARFGGDTYFCTTATNGNASGDFCTYTQGPEFGNKLYCPNLVFSTTDGTGTPVGFYCTTPAQAIFGGPALDDCADAQGQNTLRCDAATSLYQD
jgi:hypothetical protein